LFRAVVDEKDKNYVFSGVMMMMRRRRRRRRSLPFS